MGFAVGTNYRYILPALDPYNSLQESLLGEAAIADYKSVVGTTYTIRAGEDQYRLNGEQTNPYYQRGTGDVIYTANQTRHDNITVHSQGLKLLRSILGDNAQSAQADRAMNAQSLGDAINGKVIKVGDLDYKINVIVKGSNIQVNLVSGKEYQNVFSFTVNKYGDIGGLATENNKGIKKELRPGLAQSFYQLLFKNIPEGTEVEKEVTNDETRSIFAPGLNKKGEEKSRYFYVGTKKDGRPVLLFTDDQGAREVVQDKAKKGQISLRVALAQTPTGKSLLKAGFKGLDLRDSRGNQGVAALDELLWNGTAFVDAELKNLNPERYYFIVRKGDSAQLTSFQEVRNFIERVNEIDNSRKKFPSDSLSFWDSVPKQSWKLSDLPSMEDWRMLTTLPIEVTLVRVPIDGQQAWQFITGSETSVNTSGHLNSFQMKNISVDIHTHQKALEEYLGLPGFRAFALELPSLDDLDLYVEHPNEGGHYIVSPKGITFIGSVDRSKLPIAKFLWLDKMPQLRFGFLYNMWLSHERNIQDKSDSTQSDYEDFLKAMGIDYKVTSWEDTAGIEQVLQDIYNIGDKAQLTKAKGGIDLTPANMNLQTKNDSEGIKFRLDPAMLQQLQNAPGFVPVIINIQPLKSLTEFLGIASSLRSSQ